MNALELILILLVVAAALAVVSERLEVPYPILLVLGGLALAFIPGLPAVRIDPGLVLLIFLPPLLFAAAWFTSWRDFAANAARSALLAVGLVVATHDRGRVGRARGVPGMSWPVAFVLGPIVSPPDAVAATAVMRGLKIPRRIVTIVEGESLVNDATGLVAYQLRAGRGGDRQFSLATPPGASWSSPLGGVAVGLVVGWLVAQIHRRHGGLPARDRHHPADAVRRVHPRRAPRRLGRAGHRRGRRVPRLAQPGAAVGADPFSRPRRLERVLMLFNGLVFILIGLQLGAIRALSTGMSWPRLLVQAAAGQRRSRSRCAWSTCRSATYLPRLLAPRCASATLAALAGRAC